MPTTDRALLYERTLSTLGTTCTHAQGEEMSDYCQKQALFVSRFPECEAACQRICKQYLPRATR